MFRIVRGAAVRVVAELHRLTAAGPVFEPLPDVVELAEKIVEMARNGDLKGLMIAWVTRDDSVSTEYATGCACVNDMVAGAAKLNHRVVAAAISDGYDG